VTGTGGGAANGSTGGSSTGGAQYTVSTLPGGGLVNGTCGPDGTDAAFNPQLLAVDAAGNIYVTSDELDEIVPGGAATALTGLTPPANGLAAAAAGVAYYSQTANFTSATTIAEVTGSSTKTVFTPQMSPSCTDTGPTSGLGEPAGIAVDSVGNIYVADEGCFEVREIAPGGAISTLAGTAGVQGDKNGPGSMSTFSELSAIAVDQNGVVYVSEADTSLIRAIQPDGTTSTFASGARNVGGLAVDGNGNVYFSDSENNVIHEIDPSGHITTLAGNGMMGLMNGPAAMAEFNAPVGVGVDSKGNVFVADSANCVVREISPGM
jgi:hypothetical protein